jgi:hypothetical protein
MWNVRGLALGSRDRIAGSVYGTIVVLAVLAEGATAYEHELWKLEAIAVASVLILWIAHAYAHGLGESLRLGRRLTRRERSEIVGRELAIPIAATLPLLAVAVGALRAVTDTTAIWIAVAIGIVTLAVQGVRYARLEQLSRTGTAVSVAINLGFALLIVLLKALVAH